jgi:hypothetical protein
MKQTMSSDSDRASVVARIEALTPQSERQWGTMTVGAMMCHLYDAYRLAIGEKTAQPIKTPIPRRVMKFMALRSNAQWPKGLPTPEEVKQGSGGTPEDNFDTDKQRLLLILDRFCAYATLEQVPHAFFGKMSREDWMRWGYLHADHHLRQFGT